MAERPDELGIFNNQTEIGSEIEKRENNLSLDETTVETDKLREQIQETRQQMGETIDAIQEKLSFSNISEQVKDQVSEQISSAVETAKDVVYDATIGKAGKVMHTLSQDLKRSNIFNTMAEIPVPFILIGLGTGLLIYNRFHNNSGHQSQRPNNRSKPSSTRQGSMLKSARNKVGETLESVSEAAGSAFENVSGKATAAYQSVGQTVTGVYQTAGNIKDQSLEQFDYYVEENPLAVGVAAAAVGAAVALAIPSTDYENQLMGEANQNFREKAKDAARESFEKARQVAGEVQKTIGTEIRG